MRALAGRGDRVRERVARFIIVWRAAGGAWGVAGIQLGLSHSALEYLYYYWMCVDTKIKNTKPMIYAYMEHYRTFPSWHNIRLRHIASALFLP